MAKEYIFSGILATYMEDFIKEKRVLGYSYDTGAAILYRFDRYCVKNSLQEVGVTKDFLGDWMEMQEGEGPSNQAKRISVIRQFMLYLASQGITVYIPHDFCHFNTKLPHIFSDEELSAFFGVVDAYVPYRKSGCRFANEYRVLFRMLYCCGLRNTEAAGIRVSDVDLQDGILTVRHSKGDKDRLVYMPDGLTRLCREYHKYLCAVLGCEPPWFFPSSDISKPLRNSTVDRRFNEYWGMTPYASCNNKPTVHDFRFTFVVNRMNAWARQGTDVNRMIAYLCRYLGHKGINETFYYYHLVKEAFSVVQQKDTAADTVIPEVRSYG